MLICTVWLSAYRKLSSENAALMAKLEVMRQENQSQAEKLQ